MEIIKNRKATIHEANDSVHALPAFFSIIAAANLCRKPKPNLSNPDH
jgi:hypothetical protein